ncbi:uncharacterized protein LOC102805482 [Saccoglossus kowalevskii]|uniref:ATP-dependent RNA helicase DBP5-like n=1 Tax=Saccoglossus kowalevskii TaxID=10224 RepID=A0ABM0MN08_SACKO|nr:PREDICTED: ATP-dependent RNA helicase DBP5-like [Saccoglossus kowalevskii]
MSEQTTPEEVKNTELEVPTNIEAHDDESEHKEEKPEEVKEKGVIDENKEELKEELVQPKVHSAGDMKIEHPAKRPAETTLDEEAEKNSPPKKAKTIESSALSKDTVECEE